MGNICRTEGKQPIDHILELGEPRVQLDDGPARAGPHGPTLGVATSRMPRGLMVPSTSLTRPPPNAEAACLAWALNTEEQASVSVEKLSVLHRHLRECLKLFGARVLVRDATTGAILCQPLEANNMSAADTGLRLGQLLCRWGVQHGCVVRTGLHVGNLRTFTMEDHVSGGSSTTYLGDAVAVSRQLAATAGLNMMVHLSREAKANLVAFRNCPLLIAPDNGSFFLDASTQVTAFDTSRATALYASEVDIGTEAGVAGLLMTEEAGMDTKKLSLKEFEQYLDEHKVQVSKFGKGNAKSLREFYEAVVVQEKSFLTEKADGALERVVTLVRISLRTRDKHNKLRELRMATQIQDDGRVRVRNQQLGMVLRLREHGQWRDAIERCFEQKFGIAAQVQRASLAVDMDSYTFNEERTPSESTPGILTTYKVHNVSIMIPDRQRRELKALGLPDCKDFSSKHAGEVTRNWTWAPFRDYKEDELMNLLQKNGIDVDEYSSVAFAELYDEVYEKKMSTLEVQAGELVRTVRIIKVWLHADILSVDHILVTKNKFQMGATHDYVMGRPVSMRMGADQDWEDAVEQALLLRCGLMQELQVGLVIEDNSRRLTQEVAVSQTYPGLKTMYIVTDVNVRVIDPSDWRWTFIGLPDGTDFTFARRETLSTGESDVVITQWAWLMTGDADPFSKNWQLEASLSLRAPNPRRQMLFSKKPSLTDDATHHEREAVVKRRAPFPGTWMVHVPEHSTSPVAALEVLMKGKKTDWEAAKRAAARIRDEDYTCRDFHADITTAFPELRLYTAIEPGGEDGQQATTGARTAEDEYQRTIGALFAVFWLMRLHMEGKRGFCFGLDRHWTPRTAPDQVSNEEAVLEFKKRATFLEKTEWATLSRLVQQAGLSKDDGTHDMDRTLALLTLMAIHDIMKMKVLLPTVGSGLREFCGYKSGEVISDHDIALSYVLKHHPDVLPSFNGLTPTQQEVVKFTHCKLEYNMGWLVQAEAPPCALFRTFKEVVMSGQASPSDIAFYFMHWFADLAAAEPFPMEGCEKFVLKFPQRVLQRFLESFPMVMDLANKQETEVFEDYLMWRWSTLDVDMGAPPSGPGAIAKMRLVLMGQGDSAEIVKQFATLPDEDQQILTSELAMTGFRDQKYKSELLDDARVSRGPAFLVYYSPAMMQKAGRSDPHGAMSALAEIFRKARSIWPLSDDLAETSVTVRIDVLKELEIPAIVSPPSSFSFILSKTSSKDAQVQLVNVSAFSDLDWRDNRVLSFKTLTGPTGTLEMLTRERQPKLGWIPYVSRRIRGLAGKVAPPKLK
mmetsp:Transcript_27082/g.62631  ORF Transcript_27082/g.62631 Transcript_27082/m.62631 type:complete len:1301 (+) Transcript_27082:64-3966(+)